MISSVVILALLSRIVVFLLQAIFNWVVPDHNADAFRAAWPRSDAIGDRAVAWFLGGLTRWDAQYFLHIAEHGYTYEQTLAFFPLYPWLLRRVADVFVDPFLSSLLARHSALVLAGVFLNVGLFVVAAASLHRLTRRLFSKELADEALLLFCFNPASIFFSACYTESLFAAVSFGGLALLEHGHPNLATLLFFLGGFVRSNGFLSAGFLLYSGLVLNWTPFRSFLRAAVCFVPFVLFQCYAWSLFCVPDYSGRPPALVASQASEAGYKLAGRNASEWCSAPLPFSYGYVQSRYWDVGFLAYYRPKQLPNFLLALPAAAVVAGCCARFSRSPGDARHVPYVLHAGGLLLLCVLFANVQVTTRLLAAASPVLYWSTFLAADPRPRTKGLHVWADVVRNLWQRDLQCKRLVTYFAAYAVVGTALHVNFLPWT
ncbi:GPI mannosyltransferase 2 [Ixodes scapularis]